jgi:pyrroline-5-carboxylate reductase
MKIAIIGAGNFGLSIAKGLLTNKATASLYLTKRNSETLIEYNTHQNVFTTSDNRDAVAKSDILIFAVQPRHFRDVLSDVKVVLNDSHVVISVVTGFKIAEMEEIIGANRFIIRAMPNTAISVSKSMTCICTNEKGKQRVDIALTIFNRLGNSLEIAEEQMQAATVICASGIAFWMRLIRATTQGAIQLGFESKEALEMSMQTCLGAASLLVESNNHPEQEIDRVTTPGGCTIEGLNEMEYQGLSSSLIHGLIASFDKISNISKG